MEVMPDRIGRYNILKILGKGAFGIVYLAEDPLLKRLIALKTISYEKGLTENEKNYYKERIKNEAQLSAQLVHPNIVTLFDVFEYEGNTYISMEYVDGVTLDKYLEKNGKVELQKAVDLIIQCLKALAYAHSHGIVHRDVKPSNILIVKDSVVKITDFGLAKMVGTRLSQDGFLIGTPHYMSPEQIDNKPIDGRSDIFSVGVVFSEMLSGKRPFEGETISSIIKQILFEEPQLYLDTDSIPSGILKAIRKSLNKDPLERFQTCEEFIEHLENVDYGEKPMEENKKQLLPPPPPSLPKKETKYAVDWKVVTVAGATGAIITLIVIFFLQIFLINNESPFSFKKTPSEEVLPIPIEVKTDPPKATLYFDGKRVQIPIIPPNDKRKHKLVAKKGCLSVEEVISYKTQSPLTLKLTEKPFQFKVDSEPKGAKIFIDSNETDFLTPALIPRENCEKFRIKLYLEGYSEFEKEVDPKEIDEIFIFLTQKSLEGKVKLTSNSSNLKFYLDNKLVGKIGDTISLPEGEYDVLVVDEEVLGKRKLKLKVLPKETTQVYVEGFKTGKIFLYGKPEEDGKVNIDGKFFGELPIVGDKMLSCGRHSIVVISSKGRKVSFEWDVKEGEQKRIVDFEKKKAHNF